MQGFYETVGQQRRQTSAPKPVRMRKHAKILNHVSARAVGSLRKSKGNGPLLLAMGRLWFRLFVFLIFRRSLSDHLATNPRRPVAARFQRASEGGILPPVPAAPQQSSHRPRTPPGTDRDCGEAQSQQSRILRDSRILKRATLSTPNSSKSLTKWQCRAGVRANLPLT